MAQQDKITTIDVIRAILARNGAALVPRQLWVAIDQQLPSRKLLKNSDASERQNF